MQTLTHQAAAKTIVLGAVKFGHQTVMRSDVEATTGRVLEAGNVFVDVNAETRAVLQDPDGIWKALLDLPYVVLDEAHAMAVIDKTAFDVEVEKEGMQFLADTSNVILSTVVQHFGR